MNYIYNIPNKFPEYLSFKNPVICSTKGEMSIYGKYKIGFNFESNNHQDLVIKLIKFLKKDKLKTAASSAKKLHEEFFLSSVNYPKYCDFIEGLLN